MTMQSLSSRAARTLALRTLGPLELSRLRGGVGTTPKPGDVSPLDALKPLVVGTLDGPSAAGSTSSVSPSVTPLPGTGGGQKDKPVENPLSQSLSSPVS